MKKYSFFIFYLFLFISQFSFAQNLTSPSLAKFEGLEAVYLRPEILTEEAADTYLSDIKKWGAKQVFLEAGYDNKVLNSSNFFPPFDKDKDWLKIYCNLAKKYDLKVNVWVKICFWVHKEENLKNFHILLEHPDWIDTNKKGEIVAPEGTYEDKNFIFINPVIPEVKETINNYIKEVAAYDIDGISIDYIRFKASGDNPETWFGYNKYSVEKFKDQVGIDPMLIKVDMKPGSAFMQWISYNEKIIEGCVRSISETVDKINKEQKRNIVLSASPFTGYKKGQSSKFQNWKPWDDNGYIKLWIPMCMSIDMASLETEINGLKDLNLKSPFYPVVYPNQHGSLHPPMADHYEILKKCGISKFCVFSYKQLKEEIK